MAIIKKDATRLPIRLADDFAAVAERLCRSTVQVRGRGHRGGSGVIWHSSGLIITNAHVIQSPRARVELSDRRVFDATVTARSLQDDLAALKVEADNLPCATIGNSDALRVGELVLAVGNPLGLIGAVTAGIIHSIGTYPQGVPGSIDIPSSQKWVQADVRLAPGNSGGPLADARGHVIGINSMIAGSLALAVPSNEVERFLRSLEKRVHLGLTLQPVVIPLENKRVLGLLVVEVKAESPAEEAGLLIGDVLIGVRGQFFNSPEEVANLLRNTEIGDLLQLDLMRGGKRITCDVVVRARTDVVEGV